MRNFLLPSIWLTLIPLLHACSSYAPPNKLEGMSRQALVARMGLPDTERQVSGSTRLEFPRGPFGKHTWFVYLDASGAPVRSEQVLTESNFDRITPGMASEAVRLMLGRPGEVQGLARSRGEVWSYRYETYECRWFQVELSAEHTVRSTGYGQPPECMGSDEVIVP